MAPDPERALTEVQRHFLEAVAALTTSNDGLSPTLEEIRNHLALHSKCPVQAQRDRLAQRGLVSYRRYWSRSLRLTTAGQQALARAVP